MPPMGASVIVTRTVVTDESVHGPGWAAAGAGLGVDEPETAATGGGVGGVSSTIISTPRLVPR